MAKKSTDDAKKKNNKPKIIAAVVLVLVGYKFFLAPKPAAKAENAPQKEGSVVALPELTLNLADSTSRYLRVGVALVYWEGKGGGGGGHGGGAAGEDKEASIASDVAVDVLSHKTYEGLKSPNGKEEAKKEITEKLNHELHDSIARILFTSFVMQ
jgi:flagellar basal body-associated protein FliL